MTTDRETLRDELEQAIPPWIGLPTDRLHLANALLPVVVRAQQQVWNDAADELELSGMDPRHWAVVGFRACADALGAHHKEKS